jgi:uncharacterized protein YbbC (DUF1343 family)
MRPASCSARQPRAAHSRRAFLRGLATVLGAPAAIGAARAEGARSIMPPGSPIGSGAHAARVSPGIEVLADGGFAPLRGARVGLITNDAGRDAAGRRTIDRLAGAPELRLVALFSPEHGLMADREGAVEAQRDPPTGLPVHSLYGATRRPTADMLADLDALAIDLPDVGVRFYTYATTMAYAMEQAAGRQLPVVVLDRPNPIGPAGVRGPVLDADLRSFTGYFGLPVQHGMTIGELARLFNAENHIGADLTVITMRGYRRVLWFDQTGLPWIDPSPNLRSLDQIILYPGVGLVEAANVSVGRGTPSPFELVGAPWIDGDALATDLAHAAMSGVRFEPTDFRPADDRYAGETCHGIRVVPADRRALDAPMLGVALAAALHRRYRGRFAVGDLLGNLGSRDTLAAIEAGERPAAIAARWQPALRRFAALRRKYLLYA